MEQIFLWLPLLEANMQILRAAHLLQEALRRLPTRAVSPEVHGCVHRGLSRCAVTVLSILTPSTTQPPRTHSTNMTGTALLSSQGLCRFQGVT